MLELTSDENFFKEIRTLGPDDVARHSMIFPGIYPSDREAHQHVLQGGTFETTHEFFDAVRTAIANGARIEWLRTLPRPGEFGCDAEDIIAMRRMMGCVAAVGVDMRTVNYSDVAPGIIEHCGNDSPVVQDFLAGLERGDPRKSSWATFRKRQTGGLAIAYLNTIDYNNGQFLGREQHFPPGPVNEHVGKWTFSWREAYEYGERISPLSS